MVVKGKFQVGWCVCLCVGERALRQTRMPLSPSDNQSFRHAQAQTRFRLHTRLLAFHLFARKHLRAPKHTRQNVFAPLSTIHITVFLSL